MDISLFLNIYCCSRLLNHVHMLLLFVFYNVFLTPYCAHILSCRAYLRYLLALIQAFHSSQCTGVHTYIPPVSSYLCYYL